MADIGDYSGLLDGLDAEDFDDVDDYDAEPSFTPKDSLAKGPPKDEEESYDDGEIFNPPFDPSKPIGFFSGKGAPIAPPTEASLARVRALFNEPIDEPSIEQSPPYASTSDSSKRRRLDVEPLTEETPPAGYVPTFSTGNGRKLPPPAKSTIDKVSSLFKDQPIDAGSNISVSGVPPRTSGFTTGSGGAVAGPSKTAASFVSNLFNDLPSSTPPKSTSAFTSGFTTGSGAAVAGPSKTAASFVSNLFNDLPSATPPKTTSGFTTGSGVSNAPLSQDQRAHILSIFGESPAPSTPLLRKSPTQGFSSFKTPSRTTATPSQGFITPARVPLKPTTNTFTERAPPSSVKLPKAIEIKSSNTAMRRIGLGSGTPRNRSKASFVTPFKGMRSSLANTGTPTILRHNQVVTAEKMDVKKTFEPVFDLTIPPNRKSLRQANLHPQYNSIEDMEEAGIPPEIWLLELKNADWYQFTCEGEETATLGYHAAFTQLKQEKCTFATERWVKNHWSLILWKIAGEIQARPAVFDAKWTWGEVINQLKYRYEREFGAAQRPIIRRIQEHDSSASMPMILCVANVHYPPVEVEETTVRPYLELTDGWYPIYAELDECLARAVRTGKIRTGRKLAISGARLESGDGEEVLDALEKSRLVITGNSSALARWDARLGVSAVPFVAGLSSLSRDGGVIALLDIRIEKVFTMAFVPAQNKERVQPWDEDEERVRADAWKEKYESEMSRLQHESKKKLEKLEDLASLLASHIEDVAPGSVSPSDTLESDFEELLEAKNPMHLLRHISGGHLVNLARYAQQRMQREVNDAQLEIEAELQIVCPPREIRDFRVVRVVDAQEGRKDHCRTAQINVWDAKGFGDELQEGKRYLVSNIMPAKSGDWNVPKPGPIKSEIYLHTQKNTRWSFVAE